MKTIHLLLLDFKASNKFDEFLLRFWEAVDKNLIKELNQPWSYKHDFDLFDYSIRDYLSNLELPLD